MVLVKLFHKLLITKFLIEIAKSLNIFPLPNLALSTKSKSEKKPFKMSQKTPKMQLAVLENR